MATNRLTSESQNVINCCKDCSKFNFMYETIIINGGKPIFRNYNCKFDCPEYLRQCNKYNQIKHEKIINSIADRHLIETAIFKKEQREGRISGNRKYIN